MLRLETELPGSIETTPKALFSTFLAKAVGGMGTVRVQLADVSGLKNVLWTSKPIRVSTRRWEYAVEYRHRGVDVDDVRLSFLFGDRVQTVLLDRVTLRGYCRQVKGNGQ